MVFLTFSSINRSLGTDSNCTFFSSQNLFRYTRIRLHQVVMVNSLYNVTATNGMLYFTIADDSSGTNSQDYSVEVTPGYYSITVLLTTLKGLIDNQISPLTSTLTNLTTQGKVSIQISGGKYIRVNTVSGGAEGQPLLNLILGFSTTRDSDFATTLIAGRLYNVQRYTNLYLRTNIIKDRSWNSAAVGNTESEQYGSLDSIIGSIPIGSVGFQSVLNYQPPGSLAWIQLSSDNINNAQFTLVDDMNQDVDLNGLYMTITLEAE